VLWELPLCPANPHGTLLERIPAIIIFKFPLRRYVMRSFAVRGVALLVVVLAFAVPAFASPPTEASGNAVVTMWDVDPGGNLVAEVSWTGTFEGTLTHTMTNGRADNAVFEGCVDARCGTLNMRILVTWGDPAIPGYHGKWVVLNGFGELEALRGQGTFFLNSYDPVGGPYEGQIHFDPD
jgi:hypothetical protein